jgi:beta-lactamase regulating signal transducer with metallopeptidase domain
MDALSTCADALLERLAWSSAQAALLAGLLWGLMRLSPRLPAAARSLLWWLLGAQLLLGLGWHAPLRLAVLAPVSAPASGAGTVVVEHVRGTQDGAAPAPAAAPMAAAGAGLDGAARWRLALAALWLLGLAAQLPAVARQWRAARRVLRDSRPLQDPAVRELCLRQAASIGLRGCPRLRTAASIASPQVCGPWRPTVLLPAGHALDADELAMAMAHELAHLRRGDLWLGWVPALARRLFFFHPLAALAAREYALEREAACDAAALRLGRQTPQAYGRLLLRLGVARPARGGLAGASPTFRSLKRRLALLQQEPPRRRASAWLLVAAVALVGVAPYRLTAAPFQAADLPVAPPQPPAPPPPAQPASPPAPAAPAAPPAPTMPGHHRDVDVSTEEPAGPYAYGLYHQGLLGETVLVAGGHADVAQAKRLHAANDGPMFWFRHGRRAYLIRDRALVEQALAIYAPVTAYWQDDGRLEGERWKLQGPREGLLAWRDSVASQRRDLDRHAPDAAARLASLDAQQRDIEARLADLDRQLAALGPRLDAHAEQGRQVVDEANRKASRLVDEALARGLAQDASLR